MKQLLTDLQKRLESNVSLLKYIDLDWGQCDYYDTNPPVRFPCALIDWTDTQYSNNAELQQIGIVQVEIRIIQLVFSNTNVKAPENQRERAFAVYDLLTLIHQAVHGWHNPNTNEYGAFTRVSVQKIKRPDQLREFKITYKVQLSDNSAQPVPAMQPSPAINISVTPVTF